jgi:alanine racemase
MARYGPDASSLPKLLKELQELKRLRLAGLSSNFSASDHADKTFCFEQLWRFRNAIEALNINDSSDLMISIANSGALLDLPESYYNMVRVGLLLYGYYPSIENKRTVQIRPALKLQSEVLYLRELKAGEPVGYGMSFTAPHNMKIATIPIGYGDGYPRAMSNKGDLLIHGCRAPIKGRICMDAMTVDVTEIEDVKISDEVVLIGGQGDEFIGADEIAAICGTISWEITCGLSPRLPIEYLHKDVTKKAVRIDSSS